jgi:CRP/FNR family transcriptional regulator, dissimilatory nitrate respiration regulator
MEQFNTVLSKCPLFTNIKENEYKILLSCINSHTKDFQSNEYIFLAGDKINYVGIVLSGSIEIIKENFAGARHIMDFLGPSDIFAEGIVCTIKHISPVTIRVKEDSKILFIPYERIIKSCSSSCEFHVQLINNMVMLLGEKNFNLNRKIELLMLKGMREKLATYLLNESQKQNNLSFQIIPNRNELAEFLNVSRTSMCRELARMKELRILDYYQNSFKILSLDALKECLKAN